MLNEFALREYVAMNTIMLFHVVDAHFDDELETRENRFICDGNFKGGEALNFCTKREEKISHFL